MADIQTEILAELKKHSEYFERMDWKLWMLQNMIESIAKENGYTFDVATGSEPVEKEIVENSDNQPKYNKDWGLD